jgi:hypothetical protein
VELFFLAGFRHHFKKVHILSRNVVTTMIDTDDGEMFLTAVREDE